MDWSTFAALSVPEVADLVRKAGSRVCAFPVNGTRRWFLLEAMGRIEDPAQAIVESVVPPLVVFYRMLFDHGWDTLLLPSLGADLMERSPEYAAMSTEGFLRLVSHPAMLEMYRECGIRARFYGDYRAYFSRIGQTRILDTMDNIARRTAGYGPRRMFFGLFGNDPTETVGRLAVEHFRRQGTEPQRQDLVEAYYGEPVDPVSIFIGFDKCSAYDMPLLALGNEDLYFTVAPSLYLTPAALRAILYDHLYARRAPETDYADLTPESIDRMRRYYALNREHTLGVGMRRDGLWYPLPQVVLPPDFTAGESPSPAAHNAAQE